LNQIKLTWEGLPVGINRRYSIWKGRNILSKEYKAFKIDMTKQFYYQTCELEKFGRSKVHVVLHVPSNLDGDALIKPIYDSLQAAGIIDNDSQIYHGEQIKDIENKRGHVTRIEIEIMELLEEGGA